MHAAIVTGIGLLLLLLTVVCSRFAGLEQRSVLRFFILVWLAATFVHGAIGVMQGEGVITELLIALVVGGVPVACAALHRTWETMGIARHLPASTGSANANRENGSLVVRDIHHR
jgi:hypothetical protein